MYAITDITTWGAVRICPSTHGGACSHKSIPLHFQTYLFFMVGTVVSLLALWIRVHYDRQV